MLVPSCPLEYVTHLISFWNHYMLRTWMSRVCSLEHVDSSIALYIVIFFSDLEQQC